jgi:outer membrane biosynthesis protein TonB
MRAGLILPLCLGVSAIIHVVLLTAVAVPRQRVTHGETMTVDLVTPEEMAADQPRSEDPPAPMTQTPSPAAPQQQVQTPDAAPQSPAQQQSIQHSASRQAQQQPQQAQPQAQPPQSQPQPPEPSSPSVNVQQESLAEQAERLSALLNLPGPGMGNGTGAEAETRAKLTGDEISAFKTHLKSCWKLPPGVSAKQRIKVIVRLSLRPNGTLAQEPALIEAAISPLGPSLVQEAMRAIRQCAPYTMLPEAKYREWRVLDIDVSPDQMSSS